MIPDDDDAFDGSASDDAHTLDDASGSDNAPNVDDGADSNDAYDH